MSFSIALNKFTFDFGITDHKLTLVRGSDTVRDRLTVRLQTLLGEWFLDTSDGIDYYGTDGLLGSKTPTSELSFIIREAILNDPDVLRINTFQITKSLTVARRFNIAVECVVQSTAFDTATITVEIT